MAVKPDSKYWSQKRREKENLKIFADWRKSADAVARAENVLLKYYLRTARPRKEFIPEIIKAA